MTARCHLLAVLVSLAFCGSLLAADAPAAKKLNVLLLVSDDLAARLGCYGDPMVKSPNIDRLAARGVRFDKAYCQFPLCNPSRASFLTGLRPDTTKVYENATQFRKINPDAQSVGQTFQKAGYHVMRVGKLYHYGVPAQIGTDGLDDPPSWQERFNPKGRDVEEDLPLIEAVALPNEPARTKPQNSAGEAGEKPSKVDIKTGWKLTDLGARLSWLASEGEDNQHTDGKIADKAIELLEQNKDKPFFLAVGFFRPHTPYVCPKKYFDLYPPSQIKLPTVPEGYRETVPAAAFTFKPVEEAMNDDQRRLAVQAYSASTSFMDAQVGRVMDKLDQLKLADNTVIVFLSDHGYHMYEHQLWQKMTLFENSARVPLIIAAPGGAKNAVSPRVVESVDLHATLADLCGVPAPKTDGVSIKPLVMKPDAAWDKPALTQVTRGGGANAKNPRVMGYSIRTERYRYTEWDGGAKGAELYDHDSDPQELHNQAKDPKQADVVAKLKGMLPKPPTTTP